MATKGGTQPESQVTHTMTKMYIPANTKPTRASRSHMGSSLLNRAWAYARETNQAALHVFMMRKGKVIESESFVAQPPSQWKDENILSDLLLKFYRIQLDFPEVLLLPFLPAKKNRIMDELKRLKRGNLLLKVPLKGISFEKLIILLPFILV